jgi:hypothetical protein
MAITQQQATPRHPKTMSWIASSIHYNVNLCAAKMIAKNPSSRNKKFLTSPISSSAPAATSHTSANRCVAPYRVIGALLLIGAIVHSAHLFREQLTVRAPQFKPLLTAA